MRTLLATAAAFLLFLLPATAFATTVQLNPATATTAADLTITGDDNINDITITQTPAGYVIAQAGGGLSNPAAPCTGGGAAISCPLVPSISIDLAGGNDALTTSGVSTRLLAAGGTGDDALQGGSGDDVLSGGDGNDALSGAGGRDEYFGEGGNDFIQARDGVAERIACGAGADQTSNDFTDLLADCENGVDGDHDGFSSQVDCDDANPAIHPGATDVFDDGVDEDCSGGDATNLDRDRDGFPIPLDCNDADPAIHPGALEIRGNAVDENCDGIAQSYGLLRALMFTNWAFQHKTTSLLSLIVRNAPKGAKVVLSCKGRGCAFRGAKTATVPRDLAPVSLGRYFKGARLHAGDVVSVAITAGGLIGRTYSYKVEVDDLPAQSIVCRAPGAKEGRPC